MKFERKSGILLHPTSLPSKNGIGTLGKNAYEFIDWLESAKQTLWQILPLGPTGYGDSPYASFSTFAGNPLLIDLDFLVEKNWAKKSDIIPADFIKKEGNIDFGAVVYWKIPVLRKCAVYFLKNATNEDKELYNSFCNEKSIWLDKFACFMSIKSFYDKKSQEEKVNSSIWFDYWQEDLLKCEKSAIEKWEIEHKDDIEVYKVIQFFFEFQWQNLKKYANDKKIKIIGDIPIFVAPDSADVWSNQEFFQLDENGKPLCVAGVPPDYFCAEGQLWGNPLYDWEKMKNDNYSWWILRIKRIFELTDILRIDHFRGFESYWSVPFGSQNAINGKWVEGPGISLFNEIKNSLGDLPIIAEDLGVITDEVQKLRDDCELPGMKVFQFAFNHDEVKQNGMKNYFMPHNFTTNNCVFYTGTHDNDTLQGFLENCNDKNLLLIASYIEGKQISLENAKQIVQNGKLRKNIIKTVFSSVANFVVIPMQDVLGIDNFGRMNMPSTTGTNWAWKMKKNCLKEKLAEELKFISDLYGRNL